MSEPNGNRVWLKILAAMLIPLAAGLIGYGALTERVDTVRDRMNEELPRAAQAHDAIEVRTDQKIQAQRELILSKFDDVIRRLDRIERRLP